MFKNLPLKSCASLAGLSTLLYTQKTESSCDANFPYFKVASTYSPHFEKRFKNGEDATAVAANQKMILALDGVGGWISKGICSGLMTKWLSVSLKKLYDNGNENLKEILRDSVKECPHKGSTTVVMAKLERDSINTLNLGDSGYAVIRKIDGEMKMIHRSESQ